MPATLNELERTNQTLQRDIERRRDALEREYRSRATPASSRYPLNALRARIEHLFRARCGRPEIAAQIDVAERSKFGADLVAKVPLLLSAVGAKRYTSEYVPHLSEALHDESLQGIIAGVEPNGIYLNIRLDDRWLIATAQYVADLEATFGTSDVESGRRVLVDYSSPNVAKTLHAGHVRSTIIGHVLGNLHEACGARVYRVNHVNDFGGFGFILEGWRRFQNRFPVGLSENERLLEIYAIRRTLEHCAGEGLALSAMPLADRVLIERYFPELASADEVRAAYADFVRASDARFECLEAGDSEEVALWSSMVRWSLSAFQQFYDLLEINIDYTIGESFYVQRGVELVKRAVESGDAVVYTAQVASKDIEDIERDVASGVLTPAEGEREIEFMRKDIDAVVVRLPERRRLVVLRADGRSIYATRDLAAIAIRQRLFSPTDMLYVVGQEQRVHFERVFQAARRLGLVSDDMVLKHIYFGFYVDAATGRKLSSRDGVANVNRLLLASIEHFRAESAKREDLTEAELDDVGRKLAVGSVVMNDLKQAMKGSVDIAVDDLPKTIESFESAGGAYVVYAACRARAILRKYGKRVPRVSEISAAELDPQEVLLLLRIQEIPMRVARAAAGNDPSLLIRHVIDIATLYNSYYSRAPVLKDGEVRLHRLAITNAVQIALVRALAICHIAVPPQI